MKEELLKEIVEKLSDLEVGESLRIEITKYKEDGSNSNANSGTLIKSVISEENLEMYGKYKAKIDFGLHFPIHERQIKINDE